MPPAGYPAFLQYLQSGRVRNSSLFYVNVGDTEPYPQSAQWSAGSITSIEAVSVPEPSALVVSAMLGIAAMVYRRCHNS